MHFGPARRPAGVYGIRPGRDEDLGHAPESDAETGENECVNVNLLLHSKKYWITLP